MALLQELLGRSMVKKGKGSSLIEQSWKLTQRLPNLGITKNNLIGITLFIIVNVWRMVHFNDFVITFEGLYLDLERALERQRLKISLDY